MQSRLDRYAAVQPMPNLFKGRCSAPQVLITEKLKIGDQQNRLRVRVMCDLQHVIRDVSFRSTIR